MSLLSATSFTNMARLTLAASLIYVGYSISQFGQNLSQLAPLIDEIQQAQQQVPDILERVDAITAQIPEVLEHVDAINQSIPPILQRVDDITTQIPLILAQVDAVEKQIPPILAESKQLRQQVPAVLKRVDSTNKSIAGVSSQIPAILDESEAIRADAPVLLADAQQLVNDVETVGQQASEGFVSGVFTGILKAPLSILPDGTPLFSRTSLSEKDEKMMNETVSELLATNQLGSKKTWFNSATQIGGEITLFASQQDPAQCRVLKIELSKKRRQLESRATELCKNNQGKWLPKNS
ncbi:hypothetical protein ACED51_06650 [Photobacterium swingsii]|uniref:hypothetical protein n=1 Tax=Photobacterium swingsii TaxID=680026 RepID=UPI00352EB577